MISQRRIFYPLENSPLGTPAHKARAPKCSSEGYINKTFNELYVVVEE